MAGSMGVQPKEAQPGGCASKDDAMFKLCRAGGQGARASINMYGCQGIDHYVRVPGDRSDGEARAAAAGAAGVGVVELEASAHHRVFEVDFGAVEVEVAAGVAEDFDAVAL